MATQLRNPDAEHAVLGACLIAKPDVVTGLRNIIGGRNVFATPRNSLVWTIACGVVDEGLLPDPIVVGERIRAQGGPYAADPMVWLHELYEAAPLGAEQAYQSARLLVDLAARRDLATLGIRLQQLGEGADPDRPLAEVLAAAQEQFAALDTDVGDDRHLAKLRAALLDSQGLDTIPEPSPIIDGIAHRDSLIWVQGKPASGKSFLVLDWAGCIAAGDRWQGHRTQQGEVLYLIAEGASGIRPRVRAWERSAGHAMEGVRFLPMAVQSADPAQWTALCRLAGELQPAMIILDTQARITVGLDENSSQDMGMFVDRIEQLRMSAAGAAVVVVHHQGRDGEHLRGSSALDGAAETVVRVKREDDRITIDCVKQKNGPDFDPIELRLITYQSSAILGLTEPGQTVQIGGPAVKRMVASWWGADETDWVSASHIVETTGVAKGSWNRARKPLVKAGVVEEQGEGRSKRYRLTGAAPSLIGLTVSPSVSRSHETQAIHDGFGLTVSPPFRGETDETDPLWPDALEDLKPPEEGP